jgi:hypothetical protein
VTGWQWLDTPVLSKYSTGSHKKWAGIFCCADVAQLAEQLICNQQVASSSLAVSSVQLGDASREMRLLGGVPKRPTGADCKSAG